MTKLVSRYKSNLTKKKSKSLKNSYSNYSNSNNNDIKHNTVKNILDYINEIDSVNIEDERKYNYIFDNENNKVNNKNKNKNKKEKKIEIPKYKKDYTSILNHNYLLLKEERKAAFKQGKGYGAGTIKEEVSACLKLLNVKPLIFLDIGGNKGDYTKEVLKRYPKINAFVFEPSSINVNILQNEFVNLPNVKINDCALSDVNGKQKLYCDKFGSGLASLAKRRLDHFNIDMNNSEEIETKRFDDFWKTTEYKSNNNTIIDYVKIDVEGYELFVLEGFGDLVYNMRIIQFEFGGANIDTRTFFQDLWYFFKEKGFSLYRITPIGNLPVRQYSEIDEFFSTTNYIAVNNKFNNVEIVDNYKPNLPNQPNQVNRNTKKQNYRKQSKKQNIHNKNIHNKNIHNKNKKNKNKRI